MGDELIGRVALAAAKLSRRWRWVVMGDETAGRSHGDGSEPEGENGAWLTEKQYSETVASIVSQAIRSVEPYNGGVEAKDLGYYALLSMQSMPGWFEMYRQGLYEDVNLQEQRLEIDLRFMQTASAVKEVEDTALQALDGRISCAVDHVPAAESWTYITNVYPFVVEDDKVKALAADILSKVQAIGRPTLCQSEVAQVTSALIGSGFQLHGSAADIDVLVWHPPAEQG